MFTRPAVAERRGAGLMPLSEKQRAIRLDNAELVETARAAADSIWRMAVWCDERMSHFSEVTGRSPVSAFGQQMEGWPCSPVPRGLLVDVYVLAKLVESKWGRTLASVAEEMGGRHHEPGTVLYYVLMSSIGHGIGLDDDGNVPEGLEPNPLRHISDPCERYTEAPNNWRAFPRGTLAK